MGGESMTQDLSKLSAAEIQNLISERLTALLEFSPERSKSYAQKLFEHYKRLNVFPKTPGTLDASIKALIALWDKPQSEAHP
jgi:hypothetical protein